MRRRIVFACAFVVLTAPIVQAQPKPRTLTVQVLGMTGTPAAPVVFQPRMLTMQILGSTGAPLATTTFKPRMLIVQPLGMTGAPPTAGGTN